MTLLKPYESANFWPETNLTSFNGTSTDEENLRATAQIIDQSHPANSRCNLIDSPAEYYVNTYRCIKKPTVVSTIRVEDWFNQFNSSEHTESILKARGNYDIYDAIKFSIPCVTYNFRFNKYKNDDNIVGSTGLLYFDIDDPRFQIDCLDLTKVYTYYKSFGGHNYALLVKVNDLTICNFKNTYNYILEELKITEYADYNAMKATQFNVLTVDSNIYINKNSIPFQSLNVAPHTVVKKERRKAYTIEGGATRRNIRYNNLDEIDIDGEYVVNYEGYPWVNCFLPRNQITKNRNNTLLSYCNNLVWLNPWLDRHQTIEIMSSVNRIICQTPVTDDHLARIVNSIYTYLDAGTLQPKFAPKKRKIVFSPEILFLRGEKNAIVTKENAKKKIADSKKKIKRIIDNWDFDQLGKITQRGMYKNHPISKKTVEKYWPDFRDLISEINEKS
jgi:hypothetical protein